MNYVKVTAPRQQGKTSLIYRLRSLLSGYHFCIVNLTTCKANEEGTWCAMLHHRLAPCLHGSRERGTAPAKCVDWYDYLLAVAQRCMEDHRRVIIVFDEIGAAPLDWAEPFFSVIRAIYDARLEVPEFGQLTFLFAGAYNPQHLITDPRISPFNVARSIPLPDFDKQQVGRLVSQLGLSQELTERLTQCVHHWTDGHPYLTQALCDDLARNGRPLGLGDVEGEVEASARRFLYEDRNTLAPVVAALQRTPLQKDYLLEVLRGERRQYSPQAHPHQNGLELLGAIKGGAGNLCIIRNRIFERAFHDAFPLRITGSGDGDGVTEAALRQAMVAHYTLGELETVPLRKQLMDKD